MDNSVKMKIISSLEKIYHGDKVPTNTLSYFSMLKNEKKSFQIAIESEHEFEAELILNSPFDNTIIYSVEHIKSDFPMNKTGTDDYYRFSEDGYYPDLLLPVEKNVKIKFAIYYLNFK